MEIDELIYTGCLLQDAREFNAWLELTAPELTYRIQAYSPEIRRAMTWLEHDRAGLAALFELTPKHHVDHAQWHRHASLYKLRVDDDRAQALTSLVVHHTLVDVGDTHRDSGSTRLFAVGRYRDQFRLHQGRWLLSDRTVELDTRQLGIGSHTIV
ncbi:MAG: nuclear transport factor 2 family protein [Polyangiales bacterium]